jgi:hypothetical protein
MQPFQPNPYDDASPYGDVIPFVEYTEPKETVSVPVSSEGPASLASPAAPALPSPAVAAQPVATGSRLSPLIASLLVVLVFVVVAGSSFAWYGTVSYPATLYAQATAVVQHIQQSQQQAAQATATALANSPAALYTSITSTPADIVDPLNNPVTSVWAEGSYHNNFCHFSGQGLQVKVALNASDWFCAASIPNLSNFAFQVQMTIRNGTTGGMIFRLQNTTLASYIFLINTIGEYSFLAVGQTGSANQLVSGFTSSVKTGSNQTNLLTVIALGSAIYLYSNGQFLHKVNDTSFDSGFVGLGVFNDTGAKSTGEAVFSNARIWER